MSTRNVRLNRFLALSGLCSRRGADRLISTGRIRVNGRACTELGTRIDPELDAVTLDRHRVVPAERHLYLVLNKPRGYVTTMKDERGRRCVKDLLKGVGARVFPVGRLDKESEGLLLFTNDGLAAHRLMHPRFQAEKVYRVRLGKPLEGKELEIIEQGVRLEDGIARVSHVRKLTKDARTVELTIREGKKREIRRIFKRLGVPVVWLKRVRHGPISLGRLASGKWRPLRRAEIFNLLESVRMDF